MRDQHRDPVSTKGQTVLRMSDGMWESWWSEPEDWVVWLEEWTGSKPGKRRIPKVVGCLGAVGSRT